MMMEMMKMMKKTMINCILEYKFKYKFIGVRANTTQSQTRMPADSTQHGAESTQVFEES